MKKSNLFWVSFSDIMSSLFFIVLVLFAITFIQLKEIANRLVNTEEELRNIEEIRDAIQNLPKEYFTFQAEYKRFKLNNKVEFATGKCYIRDRYVQYLLDVGDTLREKMISLEQRNLDLGLDIKYLLVIEGMASKDSFTRNYELSYCRALSVYNLWLKNGIEFDSQICEVQISGSGIGGIREFSGREELKNQQVLIHILPKWGN